jgi:hypothetical protein
MVNAIAVAAPQAMRQAGFDGDFYARVLALGKEVAVMPTRKYPKELIERGVRLAVESDRPIRPK